jgi:hypothetical protein
VNASSRTDTAGMEFSPTVDAVPADPRERVIEYLHSQVVGPFDGPEEVLQDPPTGRYLMGILYPREATTADVVATEELDGAGAEGGDEPPEDPLTMANAYLPASIGMTFFVAASRAVTCHVRGASYDVVVDGRSKGWMRTPFNRGEEETVTLQAPDGNFRHELPVFQGRAKVSALWRPIRDGHLVSVSLINTQRQTDPDGPPSVEDCLFQVGLKCAAPDGEIREYPSVDFLSRDPEDEELRLLHLQARVYAIGHGCAAEWTLGADERVTEVRAAVLPAFTVPAVTQAGRVTGDVVKLAWLANPDRAPSELVAALSGFADAYDAWINALPTRPEHKRIPLSLAKARERILSRLTTTAARIRRGIDLLEKDSDARLAFRLANLAMLMQMHHAGKDVGGTRRVRGEVTPAIPDYLTLDHSWYPFQLAFALLALPSALSAEDEERGLVDLLWFPTGGGKTEAYLLITAIVIFHRRLTMGDRGAGTTVITRYTLRLLTAQQFQRAAALLCACELLRKQHSSRMGQRPVSIGLWVGQSVSPNTYSEAAKLLEEILEEAEPINKFQIDLCPWCGTEIMPRHREEDRSAYGVRIGNASFTLHCTSPSCAFHAKLPVSVIDEDLYRDPPTMLLATVDKFAQLAWDDGGKVFFGEGRHAPPSLIIQDEMHLLSGPLGTTVGVYEAAVEGLIEAHGAPPKIVASTATIRKADDQVQALFGREVRLFPPSGLSASDSFFAEVDRKAPGRRYIGLMSQGHTPHTTIVHTTAALLQAPVELALDGEAKDAYWTLVAYHNSLRELGRTATLARDDISVRIPNIARDEDKARVVEEHLVEELQGNVNARELPSKLYRLGLDAEHEDAVAVLATTNMLSVGVDIPRLGLMLMIGQPKTTSEYIQASSRVGRRRGGPGGLVVTMYVSTRPRDRSHYEGFRPYHAALYRHVEPTSVTPYSLPSRERALHAALVILIRHGVPGMAANDAAGKLRPDHPAVIQAVERLLDRVRRIDPDEGIAAARHLERLLGEWHSRAAEASQTRKPLYYSAATRQHSALLHEFGEKRPGWATLHSMRNVDRQCAVAVLGEV